MSLSKFVQAHGCEIACQEDEINFRKRVARLSRDVAGLSYAFKAVIMFYGKAGSDIRISVPIHRNQNLKTGLLRHFMKVAGLTEEDL